MEMPIYPYDRPVWSPIHSFCYYNYIFRLFWELNQLLIFFANITVRRSLSIAIWNGPLQCLNNAIAMWYKADVCNFYMVLYCTSFSFTFGRKVNTNIKWLSWFIFNFIITAFSTKNSPGKYLVDYTVRVVRSIVGEQRVV